MAGARLDFELDQEIGIGAVTAHGGVPALVEHFRSSGAAAAVDGAVSYKQRKRGLSASQTVESLLALWAAGGEPCEDLDRLRGEDGLALLLGYALPAAQTVRDFLDRFEEPDLPLLGGCKSAVRAPSRGLRGLGEASAAVIADLQRRAPQAGATIDIDATVLGSTKRAAKFGQAGGFNNGQAPAARTPRYAWVRINPHPGTPGKQDRRSFFHRRRETPQHGRPARRAEKQASVQFRFRP